MMTKSATFIKWEVVVSAIVVIAAGLAGPAYCQTDGTVLLLQQSPPQGGTIIPEAGVHHFEPDTEVALSAIPNPGYQFVYWLGDVRDPTANTTIAYLDTPKIIIAVFERAKYEILPMDEMAKSTPYGGLRHSAADYAQGGGGGGGGVRPPKWRWPQPPEEEEEEEFPAPEEGNEFPTPPQGEDFPVPIPEPATGILLAVGILALTKKQGAKNRRNK
jgi:hypothetical protein